MTARILDGNKIRDQMFAELKDEVRLLTAAGVRPGTSGVTVAASGSSFPLNVKFSMGDILGAPADDEFRTVDHGPPVVPSAQ